MTEKPEVETREVQFEEIPDCMAITSRIFAPISFSPQQWLADGRRTASVAFAGDQMVGCTNLLVRKMRLAPGTTVQAAFEHGVGVNENHRGQGVGTKMLAAAGKFMRDRADFLFVYRGGETSPPYLFYRNRTHHAELAFQRIWQLNRPPPTVTGAARASEITTQELVCDEPRYLPIHQACDRNRGGLIEREPGYFQMLFTDLIWDMIRTEWFVRVVQQDSRILGYAIFADQTYKGVHQGVSVADFATLDPGDERTAASLIAAGWEIAKQRSGCLKWREDVHRPYFDLSKRLGFEADEAWMALMGICLRPAEVFSKFVQAIGECPLTIDANTSLRGEIRLHDAGPGAPRVKLEMREDDFTRLLAARLNLAQAMEDDRVRLFGDVSERTQNLLRRLVPFTRWAYHHIEFI